MNLALVSPLPPADSPAAGLAADLLPHLASRREGGLRVLCRAPEQVCARGLLVGVEPVADLPALLASGAVDLPVYLVADDVFCAHQLRYLREHPGLVVLLGPGAHRMVAMLTEESGDLPGYRELLAEEHGEVARGWPERFLWRSDRDRVRDRLPLTGVLCRRSLGVVTASRWADRLRRSHPDLPVRALPDLRDPAALAEAILGFAAELIAGPRPLPALPQPPWPSVEVVIVGYESKDIIAHALRSILDQDYPDLCCTVVDNASSDGTADYVRASFPAVQVIESPRNLGFAGGNNLALLRSPAKYVVLFNQDAVARRDFVRELVRVAERDDGVAAVGAKMLMLRCPTIVNSTGVVMNEGGYAVDRGIGEKDTDPSVVPERVFAACGGAQLIRTSVLRELGGFDESFFMYFEDVDLCWRMRLCGYKVFYAPLAVVLHDWHGDLEGGGSEPAVATDPAVSARTERRRTMVERNRLQSVIKNFELRRMLRTLLRLRRYDRRRYAALRRVPAPAAAMARMTERAIRGANRWCLLHLLPILRRRRRVQRLRRVGDDAILAFLEPGVEEPHHVGDLSIVNDRHSARTGARLQMGRDDGRALGPGWHGFEPAAGGDHGCRWSKGQAWLYLQPDASSDRLALRVARGPVATDLRVAVDGVALPPQAVPGGDLTLLELPLPEPLPAGALVEVALRCDTFRPSDSLGVDDHRILGVRLAEAFLMPRTTAATPSDAAAEAGLET